MKDSKGVHSQDTNPVCAVQISRGALISMCKLKINVTEELSDHSGSEDND